MAKNTIVLYIRMFVLILINLWTSRLILNALGVSDYGIYDVVGGLVAMLSILTNSLSTAISRDITVELGRKSEKLKEVFAASLTVQIIFIIIVVLVAETIGLWFLNYKMTIPTERLTAANYVYQFALITFCINLINIPYNACIIAHEKMTAFAYISIMESVLRLIIAFLISVLSIDRLIFYSILMALSALLIRIIYVAYCLQKFEECAFKLCYNINRIKSLFSFAAWSFMGSSAYLLNTQGVSILSNVFFGVHVNAARGVSAQVENVIRQFINNFTMALNPQIMKSYSGGEKEYAYSIASKGAKYSCYLILLIEIPLFFECDYLLQIWLKNVPDFVPLFVRLSLIYILLDALGNPLYTTMLASGKIKKYFLVTSSVTLLGLPATYLLFKSGAGPVAPYFVMIAIFAIVLVVKLALMKSLLAFPIKAYCIEIVGRSLMLTPLIILPIPFLSYYMDEGFIRLLSIVVVNTIMTLLVLYYLGLSKSERIVLNSKIQNLRSKYGI